MNGAGWVDTRRLKEPETYVLGVRGAAHCPPGTSPVPRAECERAAQSLIPKGQQQGRAMITQNWDQTSNNKVNPGCSMYPSDWTPFFNTNNVVPFSGITSHHPVCAKGFRAASHGTHDVAPIMEATMPKEKGLERLVPKASVTAPAYLLEIGVGAWWLCVYVCVCVCMCVVVVVCVWGGA